MTQAKALSAKQVIMQKIEGLTPGQQCAFRLPPNLKQQYKGGLAIIQRNEKGKPYTMFFDEFVDGKNQPGGKKQKLFDFDRAKWGFEFVNDRFVDLAGSPQ